jgi:hypothetical protein
MPGVWTIGWCNYANIIYVYAYIFRSVTGTQLNILSGQEVKFNLRSNDGYMTFVHAFVVSPLKRCSSGILGRDFLQRVGTEISLTAQLLCTGRYSFPLKGQELEVSEVQHLITWADGIAVP